MDYQTLETKRTQLQYLLSQDPQLLTEEQKQQLQDLLQELADLYQLSAQELKHLFSPPQPELKPNHIDTALLTHLVTQYQQYQQELQKTLDKSSLKLNQQELVSYLVHRQQLKNIQDKLSQQLDQAQTKTLHQASTTKPQSDPHQINQTIAQKALTQKIQNQKLQIPAQQKHQAQKALANDISLTQPDPQQLSYLTELNLAQYHPDYQSQSSLYQLHQQIASLIQPSQQTDFLQLLSQPQPYLDTHFSDPLLSTTLNTNQLLQVLNQPSTQQLLQQTNPQQLKKSIVDQNYQTAPQDSPLFDQLKTTIKNNQISLEQLAKNSTTQQIFTQASPETHIDQSQLLAALRKQNPSLRLNPLPQAESWASFTQNIPDQSRFSPLLIRYLGRGVSPQQLQTILQTARSQSDHPLHQQLTQNLKFYSSLLSRHFQLADTEAGQKLLVAAQKSTFLASARNRLLSFFPASSHSTIEMLLSPIGSLRSQASSALGKRLFTHLAQKTTHQALKQGLQTLAQQGFKKGIKELLQKVSLKAAEELGLHLAAESLNVIPGLGVAVDIIITVTTAVIKKLKEFAQNLAITLYGEKIEKKDLLAPFALAASSAAAFFIGLGRAFRAAAAATFTAGASALLTIFLASLATLLFYVAAFNVGPLISTIAQLQSGLTSPNTASLIPTFTQEALQCSLDQQPLQPPPPSDPLAARAWEITSDLYQGFWCYWNRSPGDNPQDTIQYPPSYPNLFNETVFNQTPSPTRQQIQNCGNCMFWCTYLVQKAYRETGHHDLATTLWSPTMQHDFQTRSKYLNSHSATPSNIPQGSVIFFKITPGPSRTNHVAITTDATPQGIAYVQSNAPTKTGFIPFNDNQKGVQNLPGIEIVGFGLP